MNGVEILDGITELRPGTYALMDASQGHAIGTLDRCAATVLATGHQQAHLPADDSGRGHQGPDHAGADRGHLRHPRRRGPSWNTQTPTSTRCTTNNAILYHQAFHDSVRIGDKVRVIPVHICPVCNLYDTAYLVSGGEVVEEIPVLARGRQQ